MKVTILGCGSSVGVPSVGCACRVCQSSSLYNKRTRTSVVIEKGDTRILVDASPDLRAQALRHNLFTVDAVLFTHCHADHCVGISELQAFTPRGALKHMPVYSDFATMSVLISSNAYLFIPNRPSASWKKCHYLTANVVSHGQEFYVGSCRILPLKQVHGEVNSNGFIFDDMVAYCTDVKYFPEASWELLKNRKVLILGCLRYVEVAAHAHVDLCVEWIRDLKPETAVLTHMSHDLDYHEVGDYVRSKLSGCNIVVAYDGLEVKA